METELREMLRDRADSVPPPGELPMPVLRRARRRRLAGAALAAVTAVAVVTGSVIALQVALGEHRAIPIVQPRPSTPAPSPTTSGPPPYGDLAQTMWPAATPDQFASLEHQLARGEQTFAFRPGDEAVAFAEAVLGWSRTDIVTDSTSVSGNEARVVLWNRRMAIAFDPSIAQTVELQRFGAILGPPNPVWLVSGASTGLLDVQSPSDRRYVVQPMAPVEVAGDVTQPPAGWILRTTMEYAGSLLQGSEAQTSNDLTLNGPSFDVTLVPTAVYSDGPTLALRLYSGDGTLLGMWARRFGIDLRSPTPSPTPSPSQPPATTGGVFGAMLDAIRASSPAGWTFALTPDRLDGDWRLDGTADDGSGPGRLNVDVTARPGLLEAHPCSDPEFSQGVGCVERPLADGDLLVLRDVLDQGGNKTIEAVLIHPDRSGVGAEAGNWITSGTPGIASGGSLEQVTRPDPLYTVVQLGWLVVAVAERASQCIDSGC
jgi:hypothetical protein